jgi:hypothetical protein
MYPITPYTCPTCRALHNAATTPKGRVKPRANDVSVCCNCAALNVFNPDLTLRAPTREDLAEIMSDPDLCFAIYESVRYIKNRITKRTNSPPTVN